MNVATLRAFAPARVVPVLPPVVYLGLVYVAVFHLPFLVPPTRLVRSASYAFGYNNALAFVLLAALLAVATVYRVMSRDMAEEQAFAFTNRESDRVMPLAAWLFWAAAAVYAATTYALFQYFQHASNGSLVWEARHFLHRIKLFEIYGLRPYLDFHVEYGPLLMYPPAWIHALFGPLGISREAAYFLAHLLLNLMGLWCLFYILTRLVAPRSARIIVFALVAVAGFGPYMGLNGVLLRYTAPFFALIVGHRIVARRLPGDGRLGGWVGIAMSIAVLAGLNVLISPEIAVAFVLGWCAYVGFALTSRRGAGALVLASLSGIGVVVAIARATLPEAYYNSLLRFGEGANNLPLLPAPHILLYLITLVLIVPPLLEHGWRGKSGDAPLIGALGALCVLMMPGAFGRADPPHVMFYGLVASALAMARLANISRIAFAGYAGAYGIVFIGLVSIVLLDNFFGVRPKSLLVRPAQTAQRVLTEVRADLAPRDRGYLALLDGYPRIGVPFATYSGDHAAEAYLLSERKLDPEFYVGTVGVYSDAEIQVKIRDVGRHEFLLVTGDFANGSEPDLAEPSLESRCSRHKRNLRRWYLVPTGRLTCRAVDLDPNGAVTRFIAANYLTEEQIGRRRILRRKEPLAP